MKNLLSLLISIFILLGVSGVALASALSEASCIITAEVVDSGTETRQMSGPSGQITEYQSKFLRLEVLTTKKAGVFGDCDFIKVGEIFKITGGSNPDPLKIGDKIEAGVAAGSAMTPSGIASSFLQWEPISFISDSRPLPPAFHLQSSNEPDTSFKKSDDEAKIQKDTTEKIISDSDNGDVGKIDVVESNEIKPEPKNTGLFSTTSIVTLSIVLILVIGGIVYFLSRQRKT